MNNTLQNDPWIIALVMFFGFLLFLLAADRQKRSKKFLPSVVFLALLGASVFFSGFWNFAKLLF